MHNVKIKDILCRYNQEAKKIFPDYPCGYCNIACKQLIEVLKKEGIEVDYGYTFKKMGNGYTFLIDKYGSKMDLRKRGQYIVKNLIKELMKNFRSIFLNLLPINTINTNLLYKRKRCLYIRLF